MKKTSNFVFSSSRWQHNNTVLLSPSAVTADHRCVILYYIVTINIDNCGTCSVVVLRRDRCEFTVSILSMFYSFPFGFVPLSHPQPRSPDDGCAFIGGRPPGDHHNNRHHRQMIRVRGLALLLKSRNSIYVRRNSLNTAKNPPCKRRRVRGCRAPCKHWTNGSPAAEH